jgi:hypothetical protein
MSRKRKTPGSGKPSVPSVPYAMENEVLGLLLGAAEGDTRAQVRRIRQRHADLSETQALELIERCLQAKRTSFAIVASTVAKGDGSPSAAGQILAAFPWMDLRNVESLCAQGFVLAIM